MTKDKLYKSSLRLFAHKEEIEKYLSVKTNQLFDIQYKIYLYDLTNTYFEGKKVQAIYDKLKYKSQPFTKRKFVVHKSEIQKMEYLNYQGVMT